MQVVTKSEQWWLYLCKKKRLKNLSQKTMKGII